MSTIKLPNCRPQHAARKQRKAVPYRDKPYLFTEPNRKDNRDRACMTREVETSDDSIASSDTLSWYIGRLLQIDHPTASFEQLKTDIESIQARLSKDTKNGLVDITIVEETVYKWRTQGRGSRTSKPSHDSKIMSSAQAEVFKEYLERWRTLGTAYLKTLLFFSSTRLAHDMLSGQPNTPWVSSVGKALSACGQNNTTQYFSNVFILIYVMHKVQSIRKDIQGLDLLAEAQWKSKQSHRARKRSRLYHEAATQTLCLQLIAQVQLKLPQIIEYFGKFPSKELAKLEFRHILHKAGRKKHQNRHTKQPKKHGIVSRLKTHEQRADGVQSFPGLIGPPSQIGKRDRTDVLPWLQLRNQHKPCRKCPARKMYSPSDLDNLESIDSGFDRDNVHSAVESQYSHTDGPPGYEVFLDWDVGTQWDGPAKHYNVPLASVAILDDENPSDVSLEFPCTHNCKAKYSKATKKAPHIPKLARERKRNKRIRSYDPEDYLDLDVIDVYELEETSPMFNSATYTDFEPRVANVRLLLSNEYAGFSSGHLLPNGTVLDNRWSIEGFLRYDTHADVYAVRDVSELQPGWLMELSEAHVFLETVGKWEMYARRRKKAMKQRKRGEVVIGECWIREHESFGHSSYSTDRKRSSKLNRSDRRTWDDLVKPGYLNERHVLIVGASTMNGIAKSHIQESHAPGSKLQTQVHKILASLLTSTDPEPRPRSEREAEVQTGPVHSQKDLSTRLSPILSVENVKQSLHAPKRKHQPSRFVSPRDKYLASAITFHVSESVWQFKSGIPYRIQLLDDIVQLIKYARRLEGTPSDDEIFRLPVMPTLGEGPKLSVKSKDNIFRRELMRFVLDQFKDWDMASPETADMLKDMAFVVDLARTQRPGWGKAVFEGIEAHYSVRS